tara:strand:+ start:3715 stop:10890 length:7176 start_codon:yes stop_codon:yes gene_type:complete
MAVEVDWSVLDSPPAEAEVPESEAVEVSGAAPVIDWGVLDEEKPQEAPALEPAPAMPEAKAEADKGVEVDWSVLDGEEALAQPVRRIPGTPIRVPMPQPSAGMTTSERLSFEASGATAPEVPGLEFAGARLSQLPEELTIKPPEDIKKRSKRLTGEELEVKWAETAYVYNRLDNPSERVKVLADFFYAWDPEVAERFGLKEDGTVEAEGIWWAFDQFDKWFPTERPLRAAINSLYDLRKWYSAADLSDDIERPKFDDVARMLYRNWEQDKGSFEDGEKAFKSLGMYLSGLALGGTDEEKAKALFELDANWDQSADSTAKAITSFGWSAAKPAIKALTGANEEQFQRAKDEAVAQGEGGHMVIGLGGLMLGDTIRGITNLASGKAATSLAPEAEEAIKDLMTGGVDLTEQGKLAIASHADDLQTQARRVLMSDIVEANPAMDLSRLSKISKQIDETEDLIETYETSAVVRPDFAEAELPALRELKDTLDEQFYSVYDELKPKDVKRKGGVVSGVSSLLPAKSAEKAIKSRLRILAAMDMNDAVDVAFKYNAPLAGIDSLKVFTRLRHIAKSNDIPMNQMDKAWADAALRADARGEVLVKGVPEMSAGELLRVNGVSKTPEVADIYRRALKGEFGDAARVSAQRPEYNALETLLSRGVKGVPSFSDLKKTAKEGLENQTKVFRDLKDAARMRAAADGTTVVGRAARRAGETIASAIPGASKAAKTADGRIMRAQSLVDNISPVGFLVAHKIAGIGGVGAAFDKLRRAVNGMMHLRGPARVQAYTTQVDGFTRQIDRRHLVHPGLHYKAQKAERQRLRNASALRSRLPEVERKLATITTNKAILRIARDYIERGWIDETELAQLEQELYTAAAFRELTGVIESVEALFSLQKVGTPGAKPLGDLSVISPEDTRRAVESLRHLKTVNIGDNPAFDPEALDALASDIVAYGDAVEADLLVPLAERRRMKVGGEAEAERLDRLRNVKKQLGTFASVYEGVLKGNLGTRTELSIAKMADSYTPEITRLQGDLIEIEKRLNQTKDDVAEGFDVDAAVAEALAGAREALPGAKFAEDVLPVADEIVESAESTVPNWKKPFEESGLTRDVYEAEVIGAIKAGEDVPDSVVNALPSAKVAQLEGELELLARSLAEGTKAAEGAIKSAEKGAYGAVARKAGVAQKQAKVAARTGVRAKGGASSIRALTRQIKEAKRRANFAIPVGSKNRQLLEATRQLYRSRMAEISGIIRDEATLMRQETANAIEGLLENVIPSGIVSPDERRLVEQAVDAIMQTISPKSPEIPSVGKERINKTFRKLLDPDTLERIARRQIEVDRIKDPKKRATEQAKLDDKKLKLSESIEELVASGVKMTPLDAAIHSISPVARKATAGMPGKRLTLKDIKERAAKGSPELKAFIRSLDDLDNDLRHPKDIRRSLEATVSSSFNNLEKAAFDFQDKLRAFEASEWARGLKGMTVSQRHRVARIVQNPKHHDLIGGKKILVSELQTKLAKVSQAARKLEQEGKDNSRQVQTKADIEEKLALLGDAEESQRIIDAARVMKKFFDDWKKDLEDVGVLSDLDVDEFFSRVNVAGYIPHVLSYAGGKKIAALRAKNALPGNSSPNFARLRKITGTIDEINDRFRRELAESIVGHQALRGVYGEAAARAAEGGSFKEFAEEAAAQGTLRSYDELVDSVNVEFGLDSVYEFFETDPLVLMERYNSQASRSVADAVFIEDILDIFPMGRQFSRIYGNRADADYAASQAGYVRLDKVSHLESILRTPLPKKLREFEPYIRRRLDEGVSMPEIVTELKAFDVDVDPDIVASMRAPDVYVPVSVGEYLNWKNTSDAGYADSAFGKLADRMHSWMKAQATIAAFAHIMRNVIGNVVSTAQEIGWSAINWRYQLAAIRIWGDIGSADDIIQIGKHSLTRDEWQGIFREAGFFETPLSSDFAYEMGRGGLKQIPTLKDLGVQLASTVAGAAAGAGVGALFGVAPAAAFGGAALSLAARRALWSPKIVNGNRSLTKFAKDTIEEIKAAPEEALSGAIPGLLIGSATGGVGAILGAAIGASTMSDYLKMMGGLNASIEAQARLSMGIGAIAKGKNFDEALGSVNAALRDYSDLTPFEKNVLRRVFFFYTWEAGNLKFQLDWLRRRPRAAAMVSRFMNGLYKEQFTEEEISMIPENWRYRVILRTGASKMIGISGLPFESALDILTRGERPVFDAMVQRLHPVPLTAMEFFIGGGKSVYYGREWRDLTNVRQLKNAPPGLKWAVGFPKEGEETWTEVYKDGVVVGQRPVYVAKNPTIFYLLQRLPGWRVMNQYMAVAADTFDSYALDAGDESAKATNLDRALMFGLGYRFTSVDMETMGQIASAKLERKLLEELDRVNSRSVVEMRKLRKDYSAPKQ